MLQKYESVKDLNISKNCPFTRSSWEVLVIFLPCPCARLSAPSGQGSSFYEQYFPVNTNEFGRRNNETAVLMELPFITALVPLWRLNYAVPCLCCCTSVRRQLSVYGSVFSTKSLRWLRQVLITYVSQMPTVVPDTERVFIKCCWLNKHMNEWALAVYFYGFGVSDLTWFISLQAPQKLKQRLKQAQKNSFLMCNCL